MLTQFSAHRPFRFVSRVFLRVSTSLALLVIVAGWSTVVQASMVLTAQDVGSNLVINYSGSWDVTGYGTASTPRTATQYAQLISSSTSFDFTSEVTSSVHVLYQGTGSGDSFIIDYAVKTVNGSSFPTTGDTFRMRYDNSNDGFTLLVPSDPSNISGTVTLTNESISSVFGTLLDSGPVLVFRDDGISGATGANTITMQAVPEPSSYAMLLAGGLTAFGAAIRRRRRQAALAL